MVIAETIVKLNNTNYDEILSVLSMSVLPFSAIIGVRLGGLMPPKYVHIAAAIMVLAACEPVNQTATEQSAPEVINSAALELVAPETVGLDAERLDRITSAMQGCPRRVSCDVVSPRPASTALPSWCMR